MGGLTFDREGSGHFLNDEVEHSHVMETLLCCYARTMFQKIFRVGHEM